MQVTADVKCYHCGHISGQVEGTRTDRLVLHAFRPRPGYQGPLPRPGERLRCARCQGPTFLEDIRPFVPNLVPLPLRARPKRGRPSRSKAA